MTLNTAQTDFLTQPINESRVEKDGKGMRHVAAWDIRRHLLRIFGWGGFDIETKRIELIRETESKPGAWTVIYMAEIRLTIKDPNGQIIATFEDGATGDAQNQRSLGDAHDLAMKSALSGGLKRCAVNLGDQFGLSLYAKGINGAVVGRTLAAAPIDTLTNEEKLLADLNGIANKVESREAVLVLQTVAAGADLLTAEAYDNNGNPATLGTLLHRRDAMLKLRDQATGYTSTQTDEDTLDGVLA